MGTLVTALISEVNQRLGNRTDINARELVWLNYAYFELLLSPRFSFYELDAQVSIPTVAGTATYNLVTAASDFWFVMDIRDDTNQRTLQRRYIKDIDRVFATSGQVIRYARFGEFIQLDPVPDAVYSIRVRYRKRPSNLVSTGMVATGTEWDEILVVGTMIKGLQALKLWDESNQQKQYYEALMAAKMDAVVLEEPDEEFGLAVSYDGRRLPGSL